MVGRRAEEPLGDWLKAEKEETEGRGESNTVERGGRADQ